MDGATSSICNETSLTTSFQCECKSKCRSKKEHDEYALYESTLVCHMCGTDDNLTVEQRRSMREDLDCTVSDTHCYNGLCA